MSQTVTHGQGQPNERMPLMASDPQRHKNSMRSTCELKDFPCSITVIPLRYSS